MSLRPHGGLKTAGSIAQPRIDILSLYWIGPDRHDQACQETSIDPRQRSEMRRSRVPASPS